ncbi:MAG: ASCH domain-containing protein [Cuspidothrix sp.]
MNNQIIENYWQAYLVTLTNNSPANNKYDISQFGDTSFLANQLSDLVVKGIKTATCSALWEWEAEGSPLPEVGLKAIVIDGNEQPICIIEITQVSIKPYIDVDAQFAYNEGEGDRSLEFWRQEHWNYFSRVLPKIGKYPIPEMLLVCEYFRVVYK